MLLVTTSYDLALEQAFLDAGEEFDVVSYIASGRNRGRFCHLRARRHRVHDRRAEHVRDRAVARAPHRDPQAARRHRPGRRRASSRASSSPRTTTSTTSRTATSAAPSRSRSPRSSAAATSSSSATACATGTCGSCSAGSGAPRASRTARGRCSPTPKPLERQFWRARDIDLLEVPLDDYVAALGRYLGLDLEADAPYERRRAYRSALRRRTRVSRRSRTRSRTRCSSSAASASARSRSRTCSRRS